MSWVSYFLLMVFAGLAVAAAVSDFLTMTIPNRLPLLIAAVFPVGAVAAGFDLPLFGWHAAAAVLVLVICFAMFALNWMGGGDAKLAAAIALWLGLSFSLLEWALVAALYGGVLTLALLGIRQVPLPVWLHSRAWAARLHDPQGGIPYGIALSAAALTVYPSTTIFARLAV